MWRTQSPMRQNNESGFLIVNSSNSKKGDTIKVVHDSPNLVMICEMRTQVTTTWFSLHIFVPED